MGRGRGYVSNAQRRVALARARQQGRGRTGARGTRGRGGRGLPPAKPMPWDSTAQRESAELGEEVANERSSSAAKYSKAQSELGFGEGADNPYSRSAENRTALTNNQRGITNTAGNQLYAGSTLNAQSQARSAYDKSQKAIEDAYAEEQARYNSDTAQAARDEAEGLTGIKEGAVQRAAASEPEPLGVGKRGGGVARGRGRQSGRARAEGQNIRRPGQARVLNARARAINARVNARRGRR